MGALVRGFRLAAEHHLHAARGIEAYDHVRAFVRDPDVVVAVDAHRVRERPRVEVLADLAHEPAILVELEQLRRGRTVGGAVRVAARQHEHVLLRIHGDAGHFAEVRVRRQLEEIRHGLVRNLGRRLSVQRRREYERGAGREPKLGHEGPPVVRRESAPPFYRILNRRAAPCQAALLRFPVRGLDRPADAARGRAAATRRQIRKRRRNRLG